MLVANWTTAEEIFCLHVHMYADLLIPDPSQCLQQELEESGEM